MGKTPTVDGPLFNNKTPFRMKIDPATGKRIGILTPPKTVPSSPVEFPFSKVQQLRSDLIGWNEPNKNVISDLPQSWTKHLSGIADNVMTNSEAGLNPSQLATLREANDNWSELKNKFDNPRSPFYNAVRTETPSTLYDGVSSQRVPEIAEAMKSTLGPAIDAVQRGTIEKALKTTNEGQPNFKTFAGNFNRIPEGYRNALFTPEQASTVKDIGSTGNVLFKDANPAGTAKLGQKMAEALSPVTSAATTFFMGHPLIAAAEVAGTGAYALGQHSLAKFMNHVPSTDWLMKPAAPLKAPIKVNPLLPPASAAIAGSQQKKK
jgi:hypothetical protein